MDLTRSELRGRFLAVLAEYGLGDTGRGSGPSDVEYWVDVASASSDNWSNYWPDRLREELRKAGFQPKPVGSPVHEPTPPAPPVAEPAPGADFTLQALVDQLNRIEAAISGLKTSKEVNFPSYSGKFLGVTIHLDPVK